MYYFIYVGVLWAILEHRIYKNTKDSEFQKLEMVIYYVLGENLMLQVLH